MPHALFEAFALDGAKRVVVLRARTPLKLRAEKTIPGLDAADDRTTWVHFAMEGQWEGHPMGPFEFTREIFDQIVRNFDRQKNPVTLTYEHPYAYGDGNAIPAAGRVIDLEIREGETGPELWGLVRFTEKGAAHVRSEEYLYTSVVVDFASKDRATNDDVGAELLQVGLVNEPFLDGQQPIRLSRRASADRSTDHDNRTRRKLMKPLKEIITALLKELGDDATPEQFQAALAAELQKQKAIAGAGGEGSEGGEGDKTAAGKPPSGDGDGQRNLDATGGDGQRDLMGPGTEDATAALTAELATLVQELSGMDLAGAVAAMREKPDAFRTAFGAAPAGGTPSDTADSAMSRQLSIAENRITALSKQVEDLLGEKKAREEAEAKAAAEAEATKRKLAAEERVTKAIAERLVTEAEREDMVWLALEHPDRFDTMVGNRTPQPTKTKRLSAGPKQPGAAKDGDAPTTTAGDDKPPTKAEIDSLDDRQRKLFNHFTRTGLHTKRKAFDLARSSGSN